MDRKTLIRKMTKKYWVRKFLHLRKASKSNKFCKSAMLWIRIGFNQGCE
jgi:hypothetical protein